MGDRRAGIDRYTPGTPVAPRNQAVGTGHLTGGKYPCRVEGCWGLRLATRWPGGTITYPCTQAMVYSEGKWSIL